MSRRYHVIIIASRETDIKGPTFRYPTDAWTKDEAEADARAEAGPDRKIVYMGIDIA